MVPRADLRAQPKRQLLLNAAVRKLNRLVLWRANHVLPPWIDLLHEHIGVRVREVLIRAHGRLH